MTRRALIVATVALAVGVLWSAVPQGQAANDYQTLMQILQEFNRGQGSVEGGFTLSASVDRATAA